MTNIKELVTMLRGIARDAQAKEIGMISHEIDYINEAADLLEKLMPQPMETAPRDGTEVLIVTNRHTIHIAGFYRNYWVKQGSYEKIESPIDEKYWRWYPIDLFNVEGE